MVMQLITFNYSWSGSFGIDAGKPLQIGLAMVVHDFISKITPDWQTFRFAFAFVVPLVVGQPANGRVFVVRNTNDTTEVSSLRGALIEANKVGGRNTIILSHGSYQLSIV